MAINKDIVNKKKQTRKTGDLGEKIAVKHLKSRGFVILDTNYLKNWGELDIVATNRDILHAIEVKTYAYENKTALEWSVTHETWRPEEQVHHFKLHQIHKALETWLSEHEWEGEFQIDVVAVRMVPTEQYATINYIENVS